MLNSKNGNVLKDERQTLNLVQGESRDGVYIIDHSYNIYLLKIDETTSNFIKIKQSTKFSIDFSIPAVTAFSSNKIYVQVSRHGCGYLYMPSDLYIYDLINNSWSNATVNFLLLQISNNLTLKIKSKFFSFYCYLIYLKN